MAIPNQKYDEDIPEGHAFAETRDMSPRDRHLRLSGFKIRSRAKGREATWERGGKVYGQKEAEGLVGIEKGRGQ